MPAPRLTKAVASLSTAAVLLSTLFALPAAAAQDPAIDPGPVAPPTTSKELPAQAANRFVVKFKSGTAAAASARANAYGQAARTAGVTVKELRRTATGAAVIQTSETLTPGERASVVASLRGQASVESVAPDTFVRPAGTVSDPYFQYQWDYTEYTGGMRVPAAWDVTTGRGATVAVIDTGITTHSDLAANIVPGYDFISDPGISNDGDGRDADATDTGDYCNGATSSWHGTHVAGTIAAAGNNGRGIAGVAYGAKVQPLRALGACGGYLSDIADAVVWAAGGTVAGLPANPTPAQVINMSLGGSGQCEAYFQSALDFAASKGTVVVAAAGNENSPVSGSTPANCDKVITVGATGRNGSRAFYSNYGPEVDVSAPGGDATASAYNAILSTWNDGQTTIGSEAYGFMQGTSMAAPHVAALAALMMTSGSTPTPADVEAKMKATARPLPGTCDTGGCGTGLVDAWAAVRASTPAPPAITPGKPTIQGNPEYDRTLSADAGTWAPTGLLYFYEWRRNGEPIPGATDRSYQLDLGDNGKSISVRVAGYKQGWGSASAESDPVLVPEPKPIGAITPAPSDAPTPEPTPTESAAPSPSESPASVPAVAGAPSITGTVKVGIELRAQPGTWTPGPVAFTYQWLRNDVSIDGAHGDTYTPVAADAGTVLKVRVTGNGDAFSAVEAVSTATDPVAEGTQTGTIPVVSGAAAVGQTLTADPGTWDAAATLNYQWYRSGVAVPGATGTSYTLNAADLGRTVTMTINGTRGGYAPLTLESAATAAVLPGTLSGPAPVFTTGDPVYAHDIISAVLDAGQWTPGTNFQTQWYAAGVPIPGATLSDYEIMTADIGKTVTYRVTASKDGYATTVASTPASGVVQQHPIILGTPAVSGTAKVGYTLTSSLPSVVTPGKMGPMTPPYQFQWYRSGVAITGATAQRYTLTGTDLGKAMTVRVTMDLSQYGWAKQTQSSASTAAVAAGTLTAPVPTVSGTRKVGYALTAAPGTWTAGTTLKYQWYRSGVAIVGGTASKYTLAAADLGKSMKVRVIGSKLGYTTVAKDSASTTAVVAGTLAAPTPWISGTPRYGYTLTANSGAWTAGTTLRYQWYRSGVAIAGATARTYRLVAADRYDTLKVRVVGSKAGYTTVTKYSGSTVRIP
jgi:subtilisin family serine protease